ncbi:cytochrome d ubiquinol oxidase subunit II [Nocardiopsis dassonvillei]|uniref:cytochrome d ubiquinol oxidase subunit II n=1 Tax=Nocardiopsis dassonvillei TaxID=2014 RepID=UPI00200FB7D8|nr:cytochrome d ubiquinol oxidase subunit II [Nocardiopsis dassonvillei]MCK9870465.1 cytochrome d ubiquinol oxidase subunit II [Nocardiopsis dassonvillei]
MDLLSSALLALLVVGYLVLAGADIGLGMLMPRLARGPEQRRRVVAAVAPYFLASEVWLVAAFGVLAGLFPALEHHVVAELWPVLAVLLAGWLVRDAGLWLRARVDGDRWRLVCDCALVGGSWALAAAWGLVVAGLLAGGLTASAFTPLCAALAAVLLAALAATSGLVGPMLSRHTSAAAIAVPGLLVALAVPELPWAPIPSTTAVFVWATLVPVIPVMFVGQVWLYRMTRRPAVAPTFFA